MFERKVIYFEMDSLTKNYTPYQAEFIINRGKQRVLKGDSDTVYITHFLGNKKMYNQKENLIMEFLNLYYGKKDNFLWTYQENPSLEDNQLIAIISEI